MLFKKLIITAFQQCVNSKLVDHHGSFPNDHTAGNSRSGVGKVAVGE
jgi:hypothetical protein